jgi:uncharacterized protein
MKAKSLSHGFHALPRLFSALVLLALLLVAPSLLALEPPALSGRVNDYAHLLPAETARALTDRLAAHEQKTGHQFVVLTIPSLEGDPLEDFSIRTVEKWKLGHAKVDDGLLLLVVQRERKVRIEVGYGLEGHITDALSSRIIRNTIVPAFRGGDYAGGIEQGVFALLRADGDDPGPAARTVRGAPPPSSGSGSSLWPLLFFAPIVLLFLWLRGRGSGGYGPGGRLGGGYYGRGYRGGYWGGGGGFGGGGFGGGGGGGGFSGGGGGFGGGGASGSW